MNKHLTPEYWMKIVSQIAEASTCRVKIGCILVRRNHIQGVGYLGSVSGQPHCDDVGCLYVHAPHQGTDSGDESCIRTVHAEMNAVLDYGMKTVGDQTNIPGRLFCFSTYSPCLNCFKALLQIGVRRFNYERIYRDEWRDKLLLEIRESTDEQHKPFVDRLHFLLI